MCRQEGGWAGPAGFLEEGVRWRSAQGWGGSALVAGSLWEAEGDQVAVHFVMKLGRWRTGKSQQKDSTLLSLPPSYQGSGAGEKGRSGGEGIRRRHLRTSAGEEGGLAAGRGAGRGGRNTRSPGPSVTDPISGLAPALASPEPSFPRRV